MSAWKRLISIIIVCPKEVNKTQPGSINTLVYRQQTIFNSSVNQHTCRQLLSCSAHSLSGTYPHTASIPQCITLTNSYVTRLESYPASCFSGKWLHVGHMQSGELEWPENVGAALLRAASWHPVTIQWRYAPCHPCDVLFLYILKKCEFVQSKKSKWCQCYTDLHDCWNMGAKYCRSCSPFGKGKQLVDVDMD